MIPRTLTDGILPGVVLLLLLSAFTLDAAASSPAGAPGDDPVPPGGNVIPRPAVVIRSDGFFTLNETTVIAFDHDNPRTASAAAFLAERLRRGTGYPLAEIQVSSRQGVMMPDNERTNGNSIGLMLFNEKEFGTEGYRLVVNESGILIGANTAAGLIYGATTLLQLFPPGVFAGAGGSGGADDVDWEVPCVSIVDTPRFAWRGMHLDVGRHFFPADFIKKYIDLLSLHKMNVFHWHLTEDQGWRIEIKKYPRLTEIGAWRNGSMVGPYSDMKFDSVRYGGYYTQEEIRAVVNYAALRNVTIVPEIELPGHSLAALAAHPELSCTGGPFEVGRAWGVYEDVYCPKETTFAFLENVLAEVCDLFPGTYVHIGGDEVPKTRWKNCDSCRARIKSEGLNNEEELQSWFVRRIEKFLNSRGKQMIGWDEILEGGLAPNAAVMSWRGIEGGIAAARQSHYAVMTPGSHCYFDHYQGDPKFEPLAIGGHTTLEKVYSYEPVPESLDAAGARYILGAQGNVWTEYMTSTEQVEYMALPRMAALSEVVWSPAAGRNWDDFLRRLTGHLRVLDVLDVNYSRSLFQPGASAVPDSGGNGVMYELSTPLPEGEIRYTTDGSEPTRSSAKYGSPIRVDETGVVRAAYFRDGVVQGPAIEQPFTVSKSTGKSITLKTPPHRDYPGSGASTLTDGIRGDFSRFGRDWLGFWGPDMDAVIDLGKSETVSSVTLDVFEGEGSWIYFPKGIEVFLSEHPAGFASAGKLSAEEIRLAGNVQRIAFPPRAARYVRVVATSAGTVPAGKPGEGNDAWLFVDEIIID
ncbi:MAG TPA: family 20 glycosylhydrolase [Bacteroidota bacterium]|nr:family 20 glycosylhydrolase [Bacteroidota bacterium]